MTGGKIWYEVTGEGNGTPLLLLHGGPGFPSYYFKALAPLGKDRPVIRFDQLGCGRSDRITDTTLMTIDHHIEQIRKLTAKLNLKEFYLLGHSWGTMLGIDYYLRYPDGVKGLIMASPCLSAKMWMQDADTLIAELPDSIRTTLTQHIAGIPQDSAKFVDALNYFNSTFYARKNPLSADMDSTFAGAGLNVYLYMWGDSEFFATGTLKDFDRTNELKKINVPTLYTTGEFDEARASTVKYYQSLTPHAEFALIKNAGHATMHDNTEENIEVIRKFLKKCEPD